MKIQGEQAFKAIKPGNMMLAGVQLQRVVTYDVTDGVSFEEFGTVFRIMTRMHVSAEEIISNKNAINLYGPFPNMLVCIFAS